MNKGESSYMSGSRMHRRVMSTHITTWLIKDWYDLPVQIMITHRMDMLLHRPSATVADRRKVSENQRQKESHLSV